MGFSHDSYLVVIFLFSQPSTSREKNPQQLFYSRIRRRVALLNRLEGVGCGFFLHRDECFIALRFRLLFSDTLAHALVLCSCLPSIVCRLRLPFCLCVPGSSLLDLHFRFMLLNCTFGVGIVTRSLLQVVCILSGKHVLSRGWLCFRGVQGSGSWLNVVMQPYLPSKEALAHV